MERTTASSGNSPSRAGRLSTLFTGMLVLLIFAPLAAALPPDASSGRPPGAARLPIMTWPGPGASLLNPDTLRLVAEAGFSVNMSFLGSREANLKALDLAKAAGLALMVQDDRVSKILEDPSLPLEGLAGVAADYARHPALYGYFVTDEPNAGKFERLGAIVARLKTLDPWHPVYINLFPTYANEAQLGTPTYEEHVRRFLETVRPPFLSFDHYPVTETGLRPDYYRNLEIVRAMAAARGLDLWAFALVTPHAVYPPPTAGHVRLQLWSDIAYGAKALQYFTFATPEGTDYRWGSGLIDKSGRPGPAYGIARAVNAEIRRIEGLVLGWTSLAVYHTGPLPLGTLPPGPDSPVLGASGTPLVVGVFTDGSARYVVLVNRDHERPGSVVVRFAPGVAEARELQVGDRRPARTRWPDDRRDHLCALDLEPGEGRVFQLR
jgi:hypothetical protein